MNKALAELHDELFHRVHELSSHLLGGNSPFIGFSRDRLRVGPIHSIEYASKMWNVLDVEDCIATCETIDDAAKIILIAYCVWKVETILEDYKL